jgi:hypothetical protein
MTERIREAVKGPIDADYITRRQQEGWRLVAVEWEVEWERGTETSERQTEALLEETPFGARVARDGERLEESPSEMESLLFMMELIIQDISLSKVAEELNRKGFRTRSGTDWGPVAVFNMLPRLIELTPRIFSMAEWIERRKRLSLVY